MAGCHMSTWDGTGGRFWGGVLWFGVFLPAPWGSLHALRQNKGEKEGGGWGNEVTGMVADRQTSSMALGARDQKNCRLTFGDGREYADL